MFSWDDWKSWISNVFWKPLKSRIDSLRSRNPHFYTWVTPLPIEMNVHIANIFWQVPQIPAPCPLTSKIIISISSPLQGRRANRLPCFFSEISGCFLLISVKFGEWISSEIFETCCLYVCVFLIFHQKNRALTWFKHELSRFLIKIRVLLPHQRIYLTLISMKLGGARLLGPHYGDWQIGVAGAWTDL